MNAEVLGMKPLTYDYDGRWVVAALLDVRQQIDEMKTTMSVEAAKHRRAWATAEKAGLEMTAELNRDRIRHCEDVSQGLTMALDRIENKLANLVPDL